MLCIVNVIQSFMIIRSTSVQENIAEHMMSFVDASQDSIQKFPMLLLINKCLTSGLADILSTLNFVAFRYYLAEIKQVIQICYVASGNLLPNQVISEILLVIIKVTFNIKNPI